MFVIMYAFTIHEGNNDSFEQTWHDLTVIIRDNAGGLGSRLHQQSANTYIAYAQWRSREAWMNGGDNLPEEVNVLREEMRNLCEHVEIIHQMEVVDDLLVR